MDASALAGIAVSTQQHRPNEAVLTGHGGDAPPSGTHCSIVTAHDFTSRERDVLMLLCEGLPNKLISARLNISAGTVKIHISHILRKLGVSSRLQAALAARRSGLVT